MTPQGERRRKAARRIAALGRAAMRLALLGALLAWAGCSAEAESGDFRAADGSGNNSNNSSGNNSDNSSNNTNNEGGNAANNAANNADPNNANNSEPYIPEEEAKVVFEAPRSSRNYVFVANPGLDSVAKIDADTLEITSVETGDRPTVVQTFKEENLAVVLNEGSAEVTVIRAGDGSDYVRNLPVPVSMNALVLSPKGDYALVYFDFDKAQEDPEFRLDEAAPPFQDVALVKLEEGGEKVFHLTVGFQVLDLEFDDEGQRAFVITRTGISVVELATVRGDKALPPISVAEVDAQDETDREVEVTGDGRFAFVRSAGLEGLNVVDLGDRAITLVSLPTIPTDLDLVPGQSRAVATLRGTHQVAILELPAVLEDPESLRILELSDDFNAGQAELTPDARKAVLFTTVEERPELAVLDLDTGALAQHLLKKGVQSVAISPESDAAVVFHTKQPGTPTPGEPEDSFLAKSHAYSIVDLETGYAKIETLPTKAGEFVFGESSGRLYFLLNDKLADVRQVEVIDLGSFRTRSIRLGSPPEHVGSIPNDGVPRIYISQEHPVGRMTFIDEADLEIKTVTGFELNSLIE